MNTKSILERTKQLISGSKAEEYLKSIGGMEGYTKKYQDLATQLDNVKDKDKIIEAVKSFKANNPDLRNFEKENLKVLGTRTGIVAGGALGGYTIAKGIGD